MPEKKSRSRFKTLFRSFGKSIYSGFGLTLALSLNTCGAKSGSPTSGPLSLSIEGKAILDSPDPSIFKFQDQYFLTYTIGSGNIPIFKSKDLKNWSFSHFTFKKENFEMAGEALKFGKYYYCHLWAPEFHENAQGKVFLSFTAVRWTTPPPEGRCPPYNQDSGVYISASENGIQGPFQEPQVLKASAECTETSTRRPASPEIAFNSCQGRDCDSIIRLDQTVFKDQGKAWLGYSWYVNSKPNTWEKDNYGEHISVTELDATSMDTLSCESEKKKIFLVNPHDKNFYQQLATSCQGCEERLSFTTERRGQPFFINGFLQGVAEGASFFRRGDWVYLLASGGIWDSKSYHVFWVAAKSVEELALTSSQRVVGRYLIPDDQYSYGHGSVIETLPGEFYYVYHRLDHRACSQKGDCRRRVMISPIDFIDKKDGRGAMHIKPRL